jgi:hypothetical protein
MDAIERVNGQPAAKAAGAGREERSAVRQHAGLDRPGQRDTRRGAVVTRRIGRGINLHGQDVGHRSNDPLRMEKAQHEVFIVAWRSHEHPERPHVLERRVRDRQREW